jgi:hypothetical protein
MPPFIFNPRDMALLLLCFFLQFELFVANHRLSLASFLFDYVGAPALGDYTGDCGVFPGYLLFFLAVPVRLLLCIWIAGVKVEMELVRAAIRDVDRALGPLPTPPEEEVAASTESAGFTGVLEDTWDDLDDEPEDSDSAGQSDDSPEQTDESTEASEVGDLEDIGMFIEQYLPAEEMVRQTCPASVVTRKY